MKSRWRQHNGIAFLHLDYANFKHDLRGLAAEVNEADAVITRQAKGSVLVLIDLTDTVASAAVVEMFKTSSASTTPYIIRHAIIGISGLRAFLADRVARLVNKPMRVFKSEDAALDWLVSGRTPGEGESTLIGSPKAAQ